MLQKATSSTFWLTTVSLAGIAAQLFVWHAMAQFVREPYPWTSAGRMMTLCILFNGLIGLAISQAFKKGFVWAEPPAVQPPASFWRSAKESWVVVMITTTTVMAPLTLLAAWGNVDKQFARTVLRPMFFAPTISWMGVAAYRVLMSFWRQVYPPKV